MSHNNYNTVEPCTQIIDTHSRRHSRHESTGHTLSRGDARHTTKILFGRPQQPIQNSDRCSSLTCAARGWCLIPGPAFSFLCFGITDLYAWRAALKRSELKLNLLPRRWGPDGWYEVRIPHMLLNFIFGPPRLVLHSDRRYGGAVELHAGGKKITKAGTIQPASLGAR